MSHLIPDIFSVYRKDERKSPLTTWPSGSNMTTTKSNNQSGLDHSSSSKNNNNLNGDSLGASNTTLTPISPFQRNQPFNFNRHPYAISLDRTKDHTSSYQKATRDRDPLREIKDNSKDMRREAALTSRVETNKDKKSKKDVFGWAKPKLLNDDLYLPNVPGG